MLLGGPGLILGLVVGVGLHRWTAVVAFGGAGIAGAVFALGAATVDALAILMNLAGWAFGLTTGTGMAKLVRHRA